MSKLSPEEPQFARAIQSNNERATYVGLIWGSGLVDYPIGRIESPVRIVSGSGSDVRREEDGVGGCGV